MGGGLYAAIEGVLASILPINSTENILIFSILIFVHFSIV
jgi:hypothetical protein